MMKFVMTIALFNAAIAWHQINLLETALRAVGCLLCKTLHSLFDFEADRATVMLHKFLNLSRKCLSLTMQELVAKAKDMHPKVWSMNVTHMHGYVCAT